MEKKAIIRMEGEEEKADIKLKLVRGFDCYRVVGIMPDGSEEAIIGINIDDGDSFICESNIFKLIAKYRIKHGKTKSRSPQK